MAGGEADCLGITHGDIRQDGEVVAVPLGQVVAGWDGVSVRVLRTTATGALIVSVIGPTDVPSNNLSTGLFTAASPFSFTVIPAADYHMDYVTVRAAGQTAGATVTITLTYLYFAGVAWTTVVASVSKVVPASGVVDVYFDIDDTRVGGDGFTISGTTTSALGSYGANGGIES